MLAKTALGSTVNVADASYTNTIGDPLLTAHWVDPDFDPDQRAFYYVRVIEIPKTALDRLRRQVLQGEDAGSPAAPFHEDAFFCFRFYGAKPELWEKKWVLGDPELVK